MDLIEAYKLVEEEKLEEAYDAFTSLLDDKKQGIDARYSRSMIDISRLKTHLEDTIDDLKYFIDKKTKLCYTKEDLEVLRKPFDFSENKFII